MKKNELKLKKNLHFEKKTLDLHLIYARVIFCFFRNKC